MKAITKQIYLNQMKIKKVRYQNRFNKKVNQRNESEKMDDKKRQNKFLEKKRKRPNEDYKEN